MNLSLCIRLVNSVHVAKFATSYLKKKKKKKKKEKPRLVFGMNIPIRNSIVITGHKRESNELVIPST
jgi:hypothetical protein